MGPRNHRDRHTVAELVSNRKVTAGLLGATLGISAVLLGATPALAQDATSANTPSPVYATISSQDPKAIPDTQALEAAQAPVATQALEVAQAPETAQALGVSQELAQDASVATPAQPTHAADPDEAAASPEPASAPIQADAPAQPADAAQPADTAQPETPEQAHASAAQPDSSQAGSVIYNASDGTLVGDGTISHGTSISATDTSTGETMHSGWNDNVAILDLTKSGDTIDGHVKLANDSNERLKVEEIVFLNSFWKSDKDLADPYRPNVVADADRIQDLGLPMGLDQEETTYCTKGNGYMSLAQLRAAHPDFSWDQVTAIKYMGYLDPHSTAELTIPLKITNFDDIKSHVVAIANGQGTNEMASSGARVFDLGGWNFYWRGSEYHTIASAGSSIAAGAPFTRFMDAIRQVTRGEAHWDASLMTVDEQGNRIYDPAPQEVQDALQPLAYSDFVFINRGKASDVLYTDGQYDILLENAFDSIKNLGYTVNIVPDGDNIWFAYSYTTRGARLSDGSSGGGSTIHSSAPVYLQVSKVFDTKDLILKEPGPWSSADNLVAAQAERYDKRTMHLHSTHDIKAAGDYYFELFDDDGHLIASGMGNQPVKKLEAGDYLVRYTYTINDGHKVTKTAFIAVEDPTKPDPDDIVDIVDPTDPADPSTPADHSDSADPQAQEPDSAAEKGAPSQATQAQAAPTTPVKATTGTSHKGHVIPRLGDQNRHASTVATVIAGIAALVGAVIATIALVRDRKSHHHSETPRHS